VALPGTAFFREQPDWTSQRQIRPPPALAAADPDLLPFRRQNHYNSSSCFSTQSLYFSHLPVPHIIFVGSIRVCHRQASYGLPRWLPLFLLLSVAISVFLHAHLRAVRSFHSTTPRCWQQPQTQRADPWEVDWHLPFGPYYSTSLLTNILALPYLGWVLFLFCYPIGLTTNTTIPAAFATIAHTALVKSLHHRQSLTPVSRSQEHRGWVQYSSCCSFNLIFKVCCFVSRVWPVLF